MKALEWAVGWLLIGGSRFVSGAVTRWAGCKPSTRQRIYYANHSSHLDILLLWASLPGPVRRMVRPAAARDYWGTTPSRRFLALNVFNSIMIDRAFDGMGRRAALKTIEDAVSGMGDAHSLIIFPEGTRGDGASLGDFRSGVYHIAKRVPDVELVPVYMHNLNRILPKGKLLPLPLLSSVTFGAPLRVGQGEQKSDFLTRMRQALLALKEI